MTATLAVSRELRTLSDAELADAYAAGLVTFADALAECNRRDAMERRAATIRARQAERFDAAHAAYIRADIECRGELLSPLGERAVADAISLWRCSESDAMRWASDELKEWWHVNGRVTPAQYAREMAASKRDERETYRSERAPAAASTADLAASLAADRARQAATLTRPAPASSADLAAGLAASIAAAGRPPEPAVAPGVIARYTQALSSYAQMAESLAARIAAASARNLIGGKQ